MPDRTGLAGKTFLVGIGAQKAGTTWLTDYLAAHPDIFMSELKELHYFDVLYRPDQSRGFDRIMVDRLAERLAKLRNPRKLRTRTDIRDLIDRVRLIYGDGDYREYFEKRVSASAKLFGEFTPAYAVLPAEGFEAIRAVHEKVKLIFILRDPVDRFHSAMRMHERTHRDFDARERFEAALDEPRHVARSSYHLTLRELDKVFDRGDVFIDFYETLFSEETIRRLCGFLEVDFVPAAFAQRINAGEERPPLDEALAARARERFAEVYDFCRAEFGDRVPETWRA